MANHYEPHFYAVISDGCVVSDLYLDEAPAVAEFHRIVALMPRSATASYVRVERFPPKAP